MFKCWGEAFLEPHPSPGPHGMESPILYEQVNHEMKEGGIMYRFLK